MFGTLTALAVMGGIEAAKDVTSAVVSSHAASNAAKTQQAGADKAANALASIWGQTQKQQAPFLNAGQQSANLLGSLMRPSGYALAPMAPPVAPPMGVSEMSPAAPLMRRPLALPPPVNIWGQPQQVR